MSLQYKVEEIVLKVLTQNDRFHQLVWKQLDKEMKQAMLRLGNEVGISFIKSRVLLLSWWYVSRKMIKLASENKTIEEIEREIGKFISKIAKPGIKLPYLRNRARRAYNRISYYLKGESILDFGCGDGMLLARLSREYRATGVDIIDYREEENMSYPFELITSDKTKFEDNSFDTTILWTVLHHCEDPDSILEEVKRITRKRIIVVEGYIEDPVSYTINCFLDWYLNRPAKNQQIPVPLNYRTISQWKQTFDKLNLKLIQSLYLGIDEPVAPERHVLFVLDK